MHKRTDAIAEAASFLARGYRAMLGCDGSTVEEAVEAACIPTGLPRSELKDRIKFCRAHPERLH